MRRGGVAKVKERAAPRDGDGEEGSNNAKKELGLLIEATQ
jgi:hypothetical protein